MAKTVKDILDEIHEKTLPRTDGASYIYRGEQELHCQTSSRLYRKIEQYNEHTQGIIDAYRKYHPDRELPQLVEPISNHLVAIQKEEIGIARSHIGDFAHKTIQIMVLGDSDDARRDYDSVDVDLLTEIQHLGGSTVLIDFTRNPDIALYFACQMPKSGDSEHPGVREESKKFGRIIIMPHIAHEGVWIITPKYCNNRVMTQFSVFVLPKLGYINPTHPPFETVKIPRELMPKIREYLETNKGITDATIFNDINGYIEFQERRGGFNLPTE